MLAKLVKILQNAVRWICMEFVVHVHTCCIILVVNYNFVTFSVIQKKENNDHFFRELWGGRGNLAANVEPTSLTHHDMFLPNRLIFSSDIQFPQITRPLLAQEIEKTRDILREVEAQLQKNISSKLMHTSS